MEPRRVAQRAHAHQRVGVDAPREGAPRHVVDGVEDGDLVLVALALLLEYADGLLDHVAQAGALALREVADGVLHVLGRVAVAGENRLVNLERVEAEPLRGDVGVGQEGVVENQRQLIVGDDFVARAGSGHQAEQQQRRQSDAVFHGSVRFIMLRTVRCVMSPATRVKATATAARSVQRNSTG